MLALSLIQSLCVLSIHLYTQGQSTVAEVALQCIWDGACIAVHCCNNTGAIVAGRQLPLVSNSWLVCKGVFNVCCDELWTVSIDPGLLLFQLLTVPVDFSPSSEWHCRPFFVQQAVFVQFLLVCLPHCTSRPHHWPSRLTDPCSWESVDQ